MPEVTKEINGRAGTSQKEARTANKRPGQTKGFAPKMIKFEGKCADLKGHIYDCSDVRQSDQFTRLPSTSEGRTSTTATPGLLLSSIVKGHHD